MFPLWDDVPSRRIPLRIVGVLGSGKSPHSGSAQTCFSQQSTFVEYERLRKSIRVNASDLARSRRKSGWTSRLA